MVDLEATRLLGWVDAYERLWRTAGTDQLSSLFAEDAHRFVEISEDFEAVVV